MKNPSRRQTLAAALVYGAGLTDAFVISPLRSIQDAGLRRQQEQRHSYKFPPLSLWQREDTAVESPPDESTTGPWFFPTQPKTPIEEARPGTTGRLGMVMMQTEELLSPAAVALDEATDGWALSYADLSPESETTAVGQAFLATNIAYALAGVLMSLHGEVFLGFLTECASVASFIYHYTQLQAPFNRTEDRTVRLALMVDYVFAFSAILVSTGYLVMGHQMPPVDAIASWVVGVGCLFSCWIWEKGLPYIVLHSLWHLFSAYCGYVVGNMHGGA